MRFAPLRCFGFACLALAWTLPISANPSDRKPNAPLAVHATIPEAKALAARLYSTYDRIRVIELEAIEKKNDYSQLPGRKLMQATGELWQAVRDARQLQLMGEPAGYDIESKLNGAMGNVAHYAMTWGQSPEGAKTKLKTKQLLDKSIPKLQKVADRARGLLSQGQVEPFLKLVEAEGVELAAYLSVFAPTEKPTALQFLTYFSSGEVEIAKFRFQQYLPLAREVVDRHLAVVDQFEADMIVVIDQIKQTGSFTSDDGKSGDATVAMSYLIDRWNAASAALLSAHAVTIAFDARRANLDGSGSSAGGVAESGLEPRIGTLTDTAIQSIVLLIDGAAAQATTDNASQLYVDFLPPLSIAQRRMGAKAGLLTNACREPLANLAARNPTLAVSAEAYQRATTQPLRWRELFAADQAKRLAKQYAASSSFLASETESPRTPGQKSVIAPNIFSRWANLLVEDAVPRLVGKPVSADKVLRLGSNERLGVVPYASAHYCLVALPLVVDEQVSDLRTAISVTENHPPLSLAAAGAISSTGMQEYEVIGGTIRNVTLESRLVRFADLPAVASVIQPLGEVPDLGSDVVPPMKATCWRLDVQPTWAQHRYFVVKAE